MEEENRWLGLAVSFVGIGLLCFTFYLAYSAFVGPESLAHFLDLLPVGEERMGRIFKIATYFIAIGLLWVMGSIGGRIVKAGLDLHSTK